MKDNNGNSMYGYFLSETFEEGIKKNEIEFEQHCYDEPSFFMFNNSSNKNESISNYIFNPMNDTFSPIPSSPNSFKDSGIIIKGKNIYLVNGQLCHNLRGMLTDHVLSYSIENCNWETNAFGFHSWTRKHSVILTNPLNSCQAFQIGGINGTDYVTNNLILYDFNAMQFESLKCFPYDKNLKVTKGSTVMGVNYLFTQSPEAKYIVWDVRVSFNQSQIGNVAFLNNYQNDYSIAKSNYSIFITGGTQGSGEISDDIYEFDTRTMAFFNGPKMLNKRRKHGSFIFRKKLYVMGGFTDNYDNIRDINLFDLKTNEWELDTVKMPCFIDCTTSIFNDNYFI
ncbi:Kelch repeat type 1 and Kelch-type beta propeller domain and Galactose oxidase, beta-propeller domain-containing protein [Strongyloides ratti]|uniref:Kelch repeat type 1 and Kelch-type beta propeller domain and Galactose oxidase, beta-propeller domain-containing protein n=1 Tax=Strongyloides ratti TaxID=34506 RepID=A0A090N0X1_STRRB|nr:Kelch repeat type 1 and Kelch-type beta propeller domain and Galactose oxidase, beta-propeller domain-containing protein [Strongyloides ratti]CEF71428.1 Kelch repeat type 1 and Kelch-type beta propeller domain and Galactose oxidase, beta-propeller domain-containing protein [Strongyloides ratti]